MKNKNHKSKRLIKNKRKMNKFALHKNQKKTMI